MYYPSDFSAVMVHYYGMADTAADTETRGPETATREHSSAERWARFAADSYAEIAVIHAGNDDPEHRAKVREAQERALARGSDFI